MEIAGRKDLDAQPEPVISARSRSETKDELAKFATVKQPEGELLALNPFPAKASPTVTGSLSVSETQKPQQYAARDSRVTGTGGTAPASVATGVATDSIPAIRTPTTRTLRPQEPAAAAQTYSRLALSEAKTSRSGEDKKLSSKNIHTAYAESDFKRKQYFDDHETARYPKYKENNFESVLQNPLSTFSVDVDTASYANMRRFLNEGRMPPKDAVRIEEMINYFSYDYPQPKGVEPFSVNMEVASCPWQPEHRLLRVGLKGKEMAQDKRPPSNFVFLIDVSGSMSPQNRLPLIKQSLQMLVKRMTENDRIAIVVYASSSGVVLESTSAVNKEKILAALERLEAGGSTNGGQGIQRAYALAEEHFIKGGVNRVILCTDGDFNVGITNQDELINLIQRKAKSGVFLSVLGVGTDNYKDALMQKLADKGNGNYHYLDTLEEGYKVLVQQMNGTLVTIAKDVKIQIEFNPSQVSSYRLIGYEKRILAAEDFNNDKKDAGEIGAGHTVTALYEIVPAGIERTETLAAVDDLKYQRQAPATPAPKRAAISDSKEMLTLKLRYKKPDGDKSVLREHTLIDQEKKLSQASTDFRFAASVASFGMVLKDSEHKGRANFGSVLELAREAKGGDKEGYRAEFINLVKKARELQRD
ncbi:MAG: VWA domain-containing protein [Verrucomicrobia bacterium]|nr:VWA domain-containing protein [Verrucomicrobiota bacterium]